MIVECTECRAPVEAKVQGRFERFFDGQAPSALHTLLSCTRCGGPILLRQTNVGNMGEGDKWDNPFQLFPPTDLRANPRAPAEIQSAFQEACACYRAAAYTASAIMC